VFGGVAASKPSINAGNLQFLLPASFERRSGGVLRSGNEPSQPVTSQLVELMMHGAHERVAKDVICCRDRAARNAERTALSNPDRGGSARRGRLMVG